MISSGQYFYKTSRTYLKDAQTSNAVEFSFGYVGDLSLPPPKPKIDARPRTSAISRVRESQTPFANGRQPRDSLGSALVGPYGSTPEMAANSPRVPSHPDSDRRTSLNRQASFHDIPSTELASIRNTIELQNGMMQQLQYEISMLRAERQQSNRAVSQPFGFLQGGPGASQPPRDNEVELLRQENTKLKEKLATIASAMVSAASGLIL